MSVLLNKERFPTKLLATVYCLAGLIARLAVLTAVFVEFGFNGLYLAIPAYCLRIVMAYVREWHAVKEQYDYFWVKHSLGNEYTFIGFQFLFVFDHVLTFILPFGKAGTFFTIHTIALHGAQDKPIVNDKLVSPFALGNLALTLLENGVGWLCVCLIDSDANVTMWYFYTCGLGMMGLMLVALALTYASHVKFAGTAKVSDMTNDQLNAYRKKYGIKSMPSYREDRANVEKHNLEHNQGKAIRLSSLK